jgi:ribosomal protein S30
MAHGGIAQAGKVKGRTPKVDQKVKAKPKTGRAKKRAKFGAYMARLESKTKEGPNKQAVGKMGTS